MPMDTATAKEFKVTYYVGIMLAQGGSLFIKDDHILFVPRSIERAMGASDVAVAFDHIKVAEVTGTITESLMVRSQEKTYRFVGSDVHKICDLINLALKDFRPRAPGAVN